MLIPAVLGVSAINHHNTAKDHQGSEKRLSSLQQTQAMPSEHEAFSSIANVTSKDAAIPLIPKTDLEYESTPLIADILYRHPATLYDPVAADGASNANIAWEQQHSDRWFIEEQRYAEERIIGGLIKNDRAAIASGLQMIQWGFAHQASDGSFVGTVDPFHSTSFFVAAVARSLLAIQQSPQANVYAAEVARFQPQLHRAARWMILPDVWQRGMALNQPYTHRRYLVAAALGLTGKLTGDQDLIRYAQASLQEGLQLQQPDGVNPEKEGYDSSYQMVGVVYAEQWVAYFPDDPLTSRVVTMINRALAWEQNRVLPSGMISHEGNTRTAGQEANRAGVIKVVSHRMVLRAFAYWSAMTGDSQWAAIAERIARYYYHHSIR